ncbi:hypothetical protein [Endozoicomonas sp. SCSIO W0465]|uniref:hypothetical protein n=1 Tax=Endozoicomonas sp. SCSIO W0465 TaxID=2918516 RepID=UPI002075AF9E|nr:hypothetical protein [Endozoicomonas sp. SCSIO W0465]USE33780.1 hypothetical protein MJO57_16495 [Endozoicomonas sp. SCSIO W0465]
MLANIVEKWCLRGWYKNQKIPDLCGGAEQLQLAYGNNIDKHRLCNCNLLMIELIHKEHV